MHWNDSSIELVWQCIQSKGERAVSFQYRQRQSVDTILLYYVVVLCSLWFVNV